MPSYVSYEVSKTGMKRWEPQKKVSKSDLASSSETIPLVTTSGNGFGGAATRLRFFIRITLGGLSVPDAASAAALARPSSARLGAIRLARGRVSSDSSA